MLVLALAVGTGSGGAQAGSPSIASLNLSLNDLGVLKSGITIHARGAHTATTDVWTYGESGLIISSTLNFTSHTAAVAWQTKQFNLLRAKGFGMYWSYPAFKVLHGAILEGSTIFVDRMLYAVTFVYTSQRFSGELSISATAADLATAQRYARTIGTYLCQQLEGKFARAFGVHETLKYAHGA
jgi:hypothetical protein